MSELKEIFDACTEAGDDKNATIMKLATDGGIDITAAVREYNKLAREAGLILSVSDRTEKINEMLADIDEGTFADADARRELAETIATDYDVSMATATAHIRKFAEEQGIELPSANRNTIEDLLAYVKEAVDNGKNRNEVVEGLQSDMGYTKNSAASAWSRASRELGIATGAAGARVPLEDTVAVIREVEHLSRKEAVAELCDRLGYAESTANSFFTYLNFAKEYARQEADSANTKAA